MPHPHYDHSYAASNSSSRVANQNSKSTEKATHLAFGQRTSLTQIDILMVAAQPLGFMLLLRIIRINLLVMVDCFTRGDSFLINFESPSTIIRLNVELGFYNDNLLFLPTVVLLDWLDSLVTIIPEILLNLVPHLPSTTHSHHSENFPHSRIQMNLTHQLHHGGDDGDHDDD